MDTSTVSTQPLDMYRANLCLALRMMTMAQETRQQTWQLEAQIADSSAEILRDAAKKRWSRRTTGPPWRACPAR